MRRATHIWLVFLLPLGTTDVAAQFVRTPEDALNDLGDNGWLNEVRLFRFDGCPQDDPVGREIFDSVRDVELEPTTLARMAGVLTEGTYPQCQFRPLHEWLVEVVNRLRSAGGSGLTLLATHLGHVGLVPEGIIERDLQLAFLGAAEDESLSLGTRARIASMALEYRPPDVRVREVIEVLSRPIPRHTKRTWTFMLGRTHGSEFFIPLALAATTFSDYDLATVTTAIGSDVRDGRVHADAAGLEALRELVRQRPGLPPWAQIPSGPS